MTAARSLSRSPTQMHYAQLYKAPYIAKAKLNYSRLARTYGFACLGSHCLWRLLAERVESGKGREREHVARASATAATASACVRLALVPALVSRRRRRLRRV